MLKKCPYCGRELPRPRRRLPTGFGQISEIKGKNLARPFRAMVTVGRKENGRPICKLLKPVAYFETYEEAYTALEEYHRLMGVTMNELFRMWFKEWKKTGKYPEEVLATWKLCTAVYEISVKDIRSYELRACAESYGQPQKARIALLFRMLFRYAGEQGIIKEEK